MSVNPSKDMYSIQPGRNTIYTNQVHKVEIYPSRISTISCFLTETPQRHLTSNMAHFLQVKAGEHGVVSTKKIVGKAYLQDLVSEGCCT